MEDLMAIVFAAGSTLFVAWITWVSKLLLDIRVAVTSTVTRIEALEEWRERMETFIDDVAPRRVD